MAKVPFALSRLLAMPAARVGHAVVSRLSPFSGLKRAPLAPVVHHPLDQLYAADTATPLYGAALRTGSTADVYNVGYFPSQPSVARAAIAQTPRLEGAVFIDFGCGRGRVLAVAAEFPFAAVIGLELSPVLAGEARILAKGVSRVRPQSAPITVIEGDGLAYVLPAGPIVLYVYNSAFAALMKRLAERVVRHQSAAEANKVFIIYVNPVSAHVFDKTPGLVRFYAAREPLDADDRRTSLFGGLDESVVIWQTVSSVMHPARPGAERKVRVLGWGDMGYVET